MRELWNTLRLRLRHLIHRRRLDRDLADEVRFHLEMTERENRAKGMDADIARTDAMRRFGNRTRIKESSRELFSFVTLESLWLDIAHGARLLRRDPLLAAIAILSLGIGIGFNLTLHTIVRTVLLEDVSARDADRVIRIQSGVSFPAYRELREAGVFQGLAGAEFEELHWRNGADTRTVFAQVVTDNLFDVLGVIPALGRTFRREEGAGDARGQVAVLGHSFWERHFHSDPGVIGRTIELNGRPFTVIGVLPQSYRSLIGKGVAFEMYVPFSEASRGHIRDMASPQMWLIARLKDGMTRAQSMQAFEVALAQLEERHPELRRPERRAIRAVALRGLEREQGVEEAKPMIAFAAILLIVTTLVLLVACANVAGLLLARGASRRHEIAVRVAVGAGRVRLVRQLLAENVLLVCLAVAAGFAVHAAAGKALASLEFPFAVPMEFDFAADASSLALASILGALVILLSGLGPALRATSHRAPVTLRVRSWMVAGQVAASVVLLMASTLFLRSLLKTMHAEPGFEPHRILMANLRLAPARYTPEQRAAFRTDLLNRLRALPGVEAVSSTGQMPLGFEYWIMALRLEGSPETSRFQANGQTAGAGYFETMRVPVLRGREFAEPDFVRGAPNRVLINEELARQRFAGVDPVGKRLLFLAGRGRWTASEIIGVVRTTKIQSLGEAPRAQVFRPDAGFRLVLRTAGNPADAVPIVRESIAAIDKSAAVDFKTMRAYIGASYWPSRFAASMLGILAAVAASLAMIGIYGTLAYTVARRTREIGVRMALGATASSVVRLIARGGLAAVGAGLATGLAICAALAPLVGQLLAEGVGPRDPISFAVVTVAVLLFAAAASAGPALRASRVDPRDSLRHE